MRQVLFHIPIKTSWTPDGIPLYGFGMMLFVAFLLCTWLAGRRAARVGIAKEKMQDLVIWLFAGGLLGARIAFLCLEQRPKDAWQFITTLPRIWDGGIVLYGALAGGLLGYVGAWWFIFRKLRVSTLRMADVLAPPLVLGICLGRLGCLLNGCCYGQVACPDCATYPVTFPLSAPPREGLVAEGLQTAAGFTFAEHQNARGARVGRVVPDSPAWQSGLRPGDLIVRAGDRDVSTPEELSEYLELRNWRGRNQLALSVIHEGGAAAGDLPAFAPRTLGLYPTQVYESISMVLLLLLLLAYEPFRRREGQLMALAMVGYAVHRYLNEQLRADPRPQSFEWLASLVLFVAGVGLWLWLQRPLASATAPRAGAAQPATAGV
jgi:prolipoprotein diacylglyceryltransferase